MIRRRYFCSDRRDHYVFRDGGHFIQIEPGRCSFFPEEVVFGGCEDEGAPLHTRSTLTLTPNRCPRSVKYQTKNTYDFKFESRLNTFAT